MSRIDNLEQRVADLERNVGSAMGELELVPVSTRTASDNYRKGLNGRMKMINTEVVEDALRAAGAIVDEGVEGEDGEPGIDYERRCTELETMVADLVKTVNTLTALIKPVVFVAENEDNVAKIKKFLNENALDI